MRREKAQAGEMNATGAELIEDPGQAPPGASDGDAVVCGVLGKPQLLYAEGEHRGKAGLEIEPPFIDFAEMREEVGLEHMGSADDFARRGEQLRIAQGGESWIVDGHGRERSSGV